MANLTSMINHFIEYDSSLQLISHDGVFFKTTKSMYSKGIKTCKLCGAMMPIEKSHCKCGEEVFVFFDLPKLEVLKIEEAIKNTTQNHKIERNNFKKYRVTGTSKKTLQKEFLSQPLSRINAEKWLRLKKNDFMKNYKYIKKEIIN